MRSEGGELPWKLLGVHSSRMDMRTREPGVDESLGLNCAWYADILMTLTAPVSALDTTAPLAEAAPPAEPPADTVKPSP